MASVYDVGVFIQQKLGDVSEYKLQKLTYYAQAWSLAWDGEPLFHQSIKAWVDGPVSPELWHRNVPGNADNLRPEEVETINAVLDFYGMFSPHQLIELSHREAPWIRARRGLATNEKGRQPITQDAMLAYYGPMAESGRKRIPDAVRRGVNYLLSIPEGRLDDLVELDDVDGKDLLDWLESDGSDPWEEQ